MGIRVLPRPRGWKPPKTKEKAKPKSKTKTKGKLPVGFKHGGKVKRKK